MRFCGMCRKCPRANDPMGYVDVLPDNSYGTKNGHYHACSACIALHDPSRPDLTLMPVKPINISGSFDEQAAIINNHYCGVCHRYARENDPMSNIGIRLEDLWNEEPIQPGVYMACSECMEYFRPRICARWKKEKVIAESMTPEMLHPMALH